MRLVLAWCTAVLAGCSFDSGGVSDDVVVPDADPNAPDADPSLIDADLTMPDAECAGGALGFVPANIDVCDVPKAAGSFRFEDAIEYEIDTTNNAITAGGALVTTLEHGLIVQSGTSMQAMVVAAQDLEIDANAVVTVHGSRPLILIAYGTLRVNGLIDGTASAARGGPGAQLLCTTGTGTGGATQQGNQTVAVAGGGGGGGGGFGTAGGTGARISPQTAGAEDDPTPAGASWASTLTPMVGGCRGGNGGVADNADVAALGGGGGGALQLVAGTEVRIDGVVSVSGGGGGGAGVGTLDIGGGGGGGGSGGAILIQAPLFTLQGGAVTANGGAGGEGARETAGTPGAEGKLDDDTAATGGSGSTGGNGGAGGFLVVAGDDGTVGTGSTTFSAGGGGGGGGVGRIAVRASQIDAGGGHVSSPQFTQSPL